MANPATSPEQDSLALAERAEALLAQGQVDAAQQTAREAATRWQDNETAWRIYARASFARSDHAEAFAAFSQAVKLTADPRDLLGPMGKTALVLEEHAAAENLLAMAVEAGVGGEDAIVDLAWSQIGQTAFDRARDTLRRALEADPQRPRLWLTLGEILCAEGRCGEAVIFFEEALSQDPASAPARAGLAEALFFSDDQGERALAESAAAVAAASEGHRPGILAGHARRLLASGAIQDGLDALAQWSRPGPGAGIDVKIAARPWEPGTPIEGRLLVIGEEEVEDEILFAQVLASVDRAGPEMILAIDPRWRGLAERSFPGVRVVPHLRRVRHGRRQLTAALESPHVHDQALVGAWTSLRSMMNARRAEPADFAPRGTYLRPDPNRIVHWSGWLAGLGPGLKMGVHWRPAEPRLWRETLPLSLLGPILARPGVCAVGLLGDAAAAALADAGVALHQPPNLDPADLDEVAALCRALDVVIGPPDAITYLAAACGAETWFLAPPRHWALLGEATYPWFPKARVIPSASFNDWAPAMASLSEALAAAAEA